MEIVGERFTSKEYRSLDRTFELIHSPSAVVVYSRDSQSKSVLNRSIQLSRLLEIATLQLKEMEATEEQTRSQRDLAPLPVTLAERGELCFGEYLQQFLKLVPSSLFIEISSLSF
ncbi:hypothetical protein HZH68_011254 [Vespula germanica]|uniref:Uncharacterized protein n=1 Tax=Vespula germanica TaxID=30212 RepID=A0A834JUE8_VESGE|nr:hypothetical protein HZH68_011254 [Vespula germanica]